MLKYITLDIKLGVSMLVYLMGLADIFASIMLITGARPHTIMLFVISFLFIKGTASFLGRPNWKLYILGATDIVAIFFLWKGAIFGSIGLLILAIMLFKGFISFWNLKSLRNFSLNLFYIIYIFAKGNVTSKAKWKNSIENYLWSGSAKMKNERVNIPKEIYSKREYHNLFPNKLRD